MGEVLKDLFLNVQKMTKWYTFSHGLRTSHVDSFLLKPPTHAKASEYQPAPTGLLKQPSGSFALVPAAKGLHAPSGATALPAKSQRRLLFFCCGGDSRTWVRSCSNQAQKCSKSPLSHHPYGEGSEKFRGGWDGSVVRRNSCLAHSVGPRCHHGATGYHQRVA